MTKLAKGRLFVNVNQIREVEYYFFCEGQWRCCDLLLVS